MDEPYVMVMLKVVFGGGGGGGGGGGEIVVMVVVVMVVFLDFLHTWGSTDVKVQNSKNNCNVGKV